MHGLMIGNVTNVGLTYDPDKQAVEAPVEYVVQPERIIGLGKRCSRHRQMQSMQ